METSINLDHVNSEISLADEEMVRFLKSQQGKSKSPKTIHKYALGLEQYSEWIEDNNIHPTDVDFVDLQNYLSHLIHDLDYADKTVHIKFVPVRLFYSYLKKLGEISDDPTDKIDISEYYNSNKTKIEEEAEDKRQHLTKDEIKQLADSVPAPRLRNRLIIFFMYYTGLRRSEVSQVELDDLDVNNRTVNVEVKGGKKHTAVWHKKLDGLMKQWLEYGYRDAYPTADDSSYLFVTNESERLSGSRIGIIVDKAAKNAGLQEPIYEDAIGRERKKVTCHTLRHSFAMNFLRDGGSFEALSNRLAHSSVKTTEIYGEVEDDRGIEEYKEVMEAVDETDQLIQDKCLFCGQKGNLQTHHISYQPEKVISVCESCQQDIHNEEQYKHLRPDKSREWAEDHDIVQ